MSFSEEHNFSGESTAHLSHLINSVNSGIWEYNTHTKETQWSDGFYTSLGYEPGEIECSYTNFFENLLYFHDKEVFLKATNHSGKNVLPAAHVRLLTKDKGFNWFESTSYQHESEAGQVMYGTLHNINTFKIAQLKAVQNDFLIAETGRIAKIGGWEIEAGTRKLSLSKEVYDIFELSNHISISVEEAVSFMEPQYQQPVNTAIDNALRYCKPYDLEVLFRTARNNVIWVRTKAVPIINDFGECVSIRGIFQNIDGVKKSGLNMQSSINLLDDQNKRLQNFAYIVSHNLRSHAGNLKFMVNLFEDTKLNGESNEIFDHIKTISESLTATMGHLDDIVRIQSEISKGTKLVNFETIFNNVLSALSADIAASGARIRSDFSQCPNVNYVPAYLESIFQNLLTNAIKYKHPDRLPVINCYTKKENGSVYLIFEDNGIGIDLERNGEQLFGMYQTFNHNKDAKGIGLFITRNQVEALGGSISAKSKVNVGTTFNVKLV